MAHKSKKSKSVKPLTGIAAEIKDMLDDLENEMHRMSDWEKGFYESVSDQFTMQAQELTDNQYNKLSQVHKRLMK
jgi:beta-galactosidase beta subunit